MGIPNNESNKELRHYGIPKDQWDPEVRRRWDMRHRPNTSTNDDVKPGYRGESSREYHVGDRMTKPGYGDQQRARDARSQELNRRSTSRFSPRSAASRAYQRAILKRNEQRGSATTSDSSQASTARQQESHRRFNEMANPNRIAARSVRTARAAASNQPERRTMGSIAAATRRHNEINSYTGEQRRADRTQAETQATAARTASREQAVRPVREAANQLRQRVSDRVSRNRAIASEYGIDLPDMNNVDYTVIRGPYTSGGFSYVDVSANGQRRRYQVVRRRSRS